MEPNQPPCSAVLANSVRVHSCTSGIIRPRFIKGHCWQKTGVDKSLRACFWNVWCRIRPNTVSVISDLGEVCGHRNSRCASSNFHTCRDRHFIHVSSVYVSLKRLARRLSFLPLQLSASVFVHDHRITMSGQSAPSPTQRSASTGPNGPLTTPSAAPLVNGVASGAVSGAPAPAPTAGGSAGSGMSQQNLNQIVSRPLLDFPPSAIACF